MSDISNPGTPGDLGDPQDPLIEIDPELQALFEKLRPLLTEFIKVGIDEAQRSMAIPSARMGTCTGFDPSTTTAMVLLDLDAESVPIPVITEAPIPGDRVACAFYPGGTAWVVGILGGIGVPATALMPFGGRVDADASTSTGFGPPRGFAWARGQVVKQATCPSYYYRAGTTHNTGGEASDEVRLPDMRGRLLLGLDNMGGSDAGRLSMANTLGATGGASTVTLSQANLPAVSFNLSGGTVSGTTSASSTGISLTFTPIISGSGVPYDGAGAGVFGIGGGISDPTHSHPFSASLSGGTAASGGSGTGFSILPPYMLVHMLVKL